MVWKYAPRGIKKEHSTIENISYEVSQETVLAKKYKEMEEWKEYILNRYTNGRKKTP